MPHVGGSKSIWNTIVPRDSHTLAEAIAPDVWHTGFAALVEFRGIILLSSFSQDFW
jgi:hypothetical protein